MVSSEMGEGACMPCCVPSPWLVMRAHARGKHNIQVSWQERSGERLNIIKIIDKIKIKIPRHVVVCTCLSQVNKIRWPSSLDVSEVFFHAYESLVRAKGL